MHALKRNKREIYYALLLSTTKNVDKNGYKTATYKPVYSAPVRMEVNVSGGRGSIENDAFGANVFYTATICTADMNCPINEHSVFWRGKDPTKDPYNYVVAAPPIKTLNSILIAIREVDVKQSNG